ncbi:MAG: bifunctional DNA primase/polymerase [Terriglobales bacterium]
MSTQTAQQETLTYEPPKTFAERARPLFDRGIPVIPVAPNEKNATLKDWNTADFSWRDALAWDQEANVGCVAAAGFCYLDDDKGNLSEIVEKETGLPLKKLTYTVKTAKGYHYYFKTTAASALVGKLVNHKAANFGFDFQNQELDGARFYVVGPGSVHPSGAIYTPLDEHQGIAEIPDKMVEWLVANAEQKPVRVAVEGDGAKLHEDFDFNAWLEHYELTVNDEQDGWYGFDECPIAGYKHEGQNDVSCALFYDGEGFGFKCHAAGCAGYENGLQHLIAHLDETHEPYPGIVWATEDPAETLRIALEFGAQIAEDTEASQTSDERSESCEAAPASVASTGNALAFPEDCMYGEAKTLAEQMKMPFGLAYPALIAEWSIKPDQTVYCGTRINIDMALLAQVGGGKNVAMDRACRLLELAKGTEYKKAAPSGVRALMTLLGDKSNHDKQKTRTPGPCKVLLITHEMTDVLKMTGIENSTLASRMCDLWDDSEFEYPTKEGLISVDCRLSWIGGIPCSVDNPVRFTELFDGETSHGLYDRLLFGYSDVKFNYKHWDPPTSEPMTVDYEDYAALVPYVPRVSGLSAEAQGMYDSWEPQGGGSRIKQNCMKVALITTMMNHEETVSEECMRCAIRFMDWQIAIRQVFEPGEAVNDSARCRTIILEAMKQGGACEGYINIKRLAHDRKWGKRFGDWLVKSVIKSLADMGEIQPKVVEGEKSETMYKLRTKW